MFQDNLFYFYEMTKSTVRFYVKLGYLDRKMQFISSKFSIFKSQSF